MTYDQWKTTDPADSYPETGADWAELCRIAGQDPFEQGYQAWMNDIGCDFYPRGNEEIADAWLEGWHQAEEDNAQFGMGA